MMKHPKLWKIVLAASLAFNIAFVASAVHRTLKWRKHMSERHQMPAADLALEKEQKEELEAIIRNFRIELLQFKQDIIAKRMEIVEGLGDPDLDIEGLTTRTNELNELENQLNLAFVNTIMEVNTVLDPKQRIDFLLKLSRRWFFMDYRKKESK
jgi:uncharacterized membrane protein